MTRAASKILSATEKKAVDLDKEIAEATKLVMNTEKQLDKARAALVKLVGKRDKAAAKAYKKAADVEATVQ